MTANLIHLIGRWLPDELIPTVRRLLNHPSLALRTEAAAGLAARGRGDPTLHNGELELLQRFATSPEIRVRLSVVEAARSIAATDQKVAIDLLTRIPFFDSQTIAERLFMHLNWGGAEFAWTALAREQQSALLAELRKLRDIENYSIEEFLCRRSAEDPRTVLGLLRQRIEDAEGLDDLGQFRPVPYHWDKPLAVREHPDFLIVLRELIAWLARGSYWQRQHWGKNSSRPQPAGSTSQFFHCCWRSFGRGRRMCVRLRAFLRRLQMILDSTTLIL